jgi:hypothetical protein
MAASGMRRRRGSGTSLALAFGVAAALAACGRPGGEARSGISFTFEDRAAPGAFLLEGGAVRDRPDGAEGLWAAVRGLPRPERALVLNTATGAEVVVALFAASSGPPIRLSNAAADAIGLADAPQAVRITALRRAPRLDTTKGRF